MKKLVIISLLSVILLSGCISDSENKSDMAGKIICPDTGKIVESSELCYKSYTREENSTEIHTCPEKTLVSNPYICTVEEKLTPDFESSIPTDISPTELNYIGLEDENFYIDLSAPPCYGKKSHAVFYMKPDTCRPQTIFFKDDSNTWKMPVETLNNYMTENYLCKISTENVEGCIKELVTALGPNTWGYIKIE